jgi:HK97 family phage major capsid protein
MDTQITPASKAAEGLLASMKEKFVPRENVEAIVKAAIESEVAKAKADLLQQMLDAKKAPAFAGSRKWIIRSQFTGRAQEMEYSFGRLLYALYYRREHACYPQEKEFEHEAEFLKGAEKIRMEQRAVSEGTSGAGGTLIPQEWTDFVIPELGAQVVFLKAGPNVLPMQHQILNIPGLTNNQTCYWIGENASITESSPTTNNTPLTLHTAASLTGISIQWLRDATPETDAALQANIVRGIVRFVDSAMFNGTGSSNQPTGLLNVSSVTQNYTGQGAANGSAPTYDDLSLAIYALESNNAPRAGRCWFMHPREIDQLRRLKDTLGRPIFLDNFFANVQKENLVGPTAPVDALFRGADGMLLGYPVFTTTAIPINQTRGTSSSASTIFFVAMSDIYVGQGVKSQGLEVAISDQALFTDAEIAVRTLYRTDVQPGHPVSICLVGGAL